MYLCLVFTHACVLGPSRAGIFSFLLALEFLAVIGTSQKDEGPDVRDVDVM